MRVLRFFRALWFSVRGLVVRDSVGGEIDEELAFHIERETRLYEQQGMTPADARRAATRTFGGVQRYREECRDVRRVSWLEDLRTDVRYALRLAWHHPGFSTNVVLISALGIAACVTTFSLVSGIILAPLSFPGQDKVFTIELGSSQGSSAGIPAEAYWRIAGAPVFDGVTASEPGGAIGVSGGEPARISTALVTTSFFRVFNVRPFAGRTFTDDEVANRVPVALLSYEAWHTEYNGDQGAIGRRVDLDGTPHTIIGVMPQGFLGPFEGRQSVPELWMPLRVGPTGLLNLKARVADTVSAERAEAWLRATLHVKVEARRTTDSLVATPALIPMTEEVYGDVKQPLSILLASVVLVLILVAANVATMFLARSASREGELGVRAALGASEGRQVRQLITESLTLTTLGGSLGLGASLALTSTIRALGATVLPRMSNVSIDWRVLAFAVAGVLLTGCAGGVAHALASRRARRADASTRVTRRPASTVLVIVQVALSVVLLVGAGLLVKGFMRVAPTHPGFTLRNRATVGIRLLNRGAGESSAPVVRQRISDIADGMRRVPGVDDVAVTSFLPLTGSVAIAEVEPQGVAAGTKRLTAYSNAISPNYFTVMGIPVSLGRAFAAADRDGAERVAIINETAAARWWGDESPIGRRLTIKGAMAGGVVTVVGVVRGSRMFGRDTRLVAELYTPVGQSLMGWTSFVAATSVEPERVLAALRRAVHNVVPDLPITKSSDLETTASESSRVARFYAVAMGLFAAAAVILSALGVYGLLSFAVAQRRREIGIRLALGATSSLIGRTVIGRAFAIGAVGVVAGGAIARGLSRYLESLLLEVTATDPTVFATAIAVVFIFALLAALAPTYQAVRVDPIKSLRSDV